jgi:hypothetical protein
MLDNIGFCFFSVIGRWAASEGDNSYRAHVTHFDIGCPSPDKGAGNQPPAAVIALVDAAASLDRTVYSARVTIVTGLGLGLGLGLELGLGLGLG